MKGPLVDTQCEFPDGRKVADIRAYKQALAVLPDQLTRGCVRKLAAFATGERVEVYAASGAAAVVNAIRFEHNHR